MQAGTSPPTRSGGASTTWLKDIEFVTPADPVGRRSRQHGYGCLVEDKAAQAAPSAPCLQAPPGGCPSAAGWAPPPVAAAGAAPQRCCRSLAGVAQRVQHRGHSVKWQLELGGGQHAVPRCGRKSLNPNLLQAATFAARPHLQAQRWAQRQVPAASPRLLNNPTTHPDAAQPTTLRHAPAWLTTSAALRRCSASEGANSKYSTASPLCRRPVRRLGGSSRRGRYSALQEVGGAHVRGWGWGGPRALHLHISSDGEDWLQAWVVAKAGPSCSPLPYACTCRSA